MPITISGSTGIAGVDGSASTPAVQGTDTNTGEFFPAADTIAWTTGGTERMRVDSSGNVGIGTSSPDYKLTIQNSDAAISLKDSGGITRAYVGVAGALGTAPTGALRLRSDQGGFSYGYLGTEQMRIDTSANLQFNSGYGSVATAYGCRAWVNFNGTGTVAIRASGNVTSITDNGTGDYTVNMTNAMPDANYSYNVSVGSTNDVPRLVLNATGGVQTEVAPTTSAFRFFTNNAGNSAQVDCKYYNVAVFR